MHNNKHRGDLSGGNLRNSKWVRIMIFGLFVCILLIPLTISAARSNNQTDVAYLRLEDGKFEQINTERTPEPKPNGLFGDTFDNFVNFIDANILSAITSSRSTDDWITIFEDDFEGDFPGEWGLLDQDGSTGGEYYWYKSDCRSDSGSYSAWAIGGGADGSGLSCGADYPAGAFSWMTYGPFSLADASDAEFKLDFWLNSVYDEDTSEYDRIFIGASIDGNDFYGNQLAGYTDWTEYILDLTAIPTLGDLTGEAEVWVTVAFRDFGTVQLAEGAFVDDVVIRKDVASPTPDNTETESPPTDTLEPTATNTPVSLAVNLPYVAKDRYVGPTLTPSMTPTPSDTPTPTNTLEPGIAMDGTWEGGNNRGDEITMEVSGNGTEVDVELFIYWDACGVYATSQFFYNLPIQSDGSFHTYRNSGTAITEIWGQFTSETTAEGNYEAEITPLFTSCRATKDADWTAVYIP